MIKENKEPEVTTELVEGDFNAPNSGIFSKPTTGEKGQDATVEKEKEDELAFMDDLEFIKSLNVISPEELGGDDLDTFIKHQKDLLRAKFNKGKMKKYLQESRKKINARMEESKEEQKSDDPSFTKEIQDFEADKVDVEKE